MYEERNTGTNLPAEIKISAVDGDAYKFLFIAKGGGSANKSYLFQETKALLNEATLLPWIFEKMQTLGTAACPPYHLAVVIGGTSAEFAVETAKLASTHYLDSLPTDGLARRPRVPRRRARGARCSQLAQQTGIGAQFGGKYFCHDVRIIRLPRHGASCPVAMAVSCSADRQALGKITARRRVPRAARDATRRGSCPTSPTTTSTTPTVVHIDLNRPMAEILAELSQLPGDDPGDADRPDGRRPRHRPRQDQGAPRRRRADAAVPARPLRVLRRPGEDAGGLRLGLVRPDDGRADGQLRRPVPGRRRLDGDARQGQPLASRSPTRAREHGGFYLGSIGGPAARLALDNIKQGRGARVPRARHGGGVEDRGRRLPGVHRRRRQGQRLLRAGPPEARRRPPRSPSASHRVVRSDPVARAAGSGQTGVSRPRRRRRGRRPRRSGRRAGGG